MMRRFLDRSRLVYRGYVRVLSYVADLLLLVVRLYWGSVLVQSGWGKLTNLDTTAQFFDSLGIIWPKFSAAVSGGAEFGCGLLLMIGLASRIAALVLSINMLVAFVMGHREQFLALFTSPHDFVRAPPFLALLASLMVLVFGSGVISVDGLLGWFLGRLPVESSAMREALQLAEPEKVNRGRREFAKLTLAAVAGLVAGVFLRRATEQTPEKERIGSPARGDKASGAVDKAALPTTPPGTDVTLLVRGDPHVCRGLNLCKGKGKDHKNSCAGQGACASAEEHACNGLNTCKGQGGCDGTAGINQCKGKGACAVPLKEEVWKLARSRFEQLAKAKQIKLGAAPAAPAEG
jgi:uncharacterized membrane protein YphA (DoxX/SURF4 family)